MARTSTTTSTHHNHHHHHHHSFRPPRSTPQTSTVESFGTNTGSTGTIPIVGAIPGFRTSAAFLSSLGANLRIPDTDLLPSPLLTPSIRPSIEGSNGYLPPLSPPTRGLLNSDDYPSTILPPAAMSATSSQQPSESPAENATTATNDDPLADVPALTTYTATTEEDTIKALKLVADSIAQQRQTAARVLTTHPLNVSVMVVVLAMIGQFMYKSSSDWGKVITTVGGLVMTVLAVVRYITKEYIFAAEAFKYDWLNEDDTVLVTKYGEEIIGTCVVGWHGGSGAKKRGSRAAPLKGVIRAWTVRLRYRRKGVGRALLEEAVDLVKSRGSDDIEIADDHPNSLRVLKPDFYNKTFDRSDAKARKTLADVLAERKSSGRKR